MKKIKKFLASLGSKSSMSSHAFHWAIICMALLLSVFVLQAYGPLFQATLFPLPHHAPYDGLTLPVKKVPDWVKLSSEERNLPYSSLPFDKIINTPTYNPLHFMVSFEQLKWGTESDNIIRNEKITYSVPYLGTYHLDDAEGMGSHPAVDIKIPEGTPIFAIGNAVVAKVSMQSSGFGVHVVLRHDDFPDLDDPAKKSTYYSSYNHLSSIFVTEGDVVVKGQQIALSGSTGTSTTPHMHFQIDKESAPFHPYWPFTSSEVSQAGLDFFSAINEGLGRENGLMYTINPMAYVQAHQYDGALVASGQVTVEQENRQEISEEVYPAPEEITVLEPVEEPVLAQEIIIQEPVQEPIQEPAVIEEIIPMEATNSLFNDVELNDPDYLAFEYLYNKGVLKGYSDGSLQPNRSVLRVEAVKMILAGIGYEFKNEQEAMALFSDLDKKEWYVPYVSAAYENGFVNGYPDGTFRPVDQVNLVEFYKMLFLAMQLDLDPDVTEELPEGTDSGAWYAPYIQEALRKNILDYSGDVLNVAKPLTRREIARAMYKISAIIETGAGSYSEDLIF